MAELDSIFTRSVGKKYRLILIILLIIPLGLSGGVITLATPYITGSMGAIPADVTMAGYAQAIGLVLGIPAVFTVKKIIPSKWALMIVYCALFVSNIAIAHADQPLFLVIGSFASGFFKIIGQLVLLNQMLPILMPKGERHKLYSIYFPVILITAQFSSIIVVQVADLYNWQIGQMVLNLFLIVAMLFTVFFVHPWQMEDPGRLSEFDWLDLVLIAVGMLLFNYVLSYGLTFDWFASSKILAATLGSLLGLSLILIRAIAVCKPAVNMTALYYGNVRYGLVVMFFLSVFYVGNNIQNNLQAVVLNGNTVETTRINLYVIGGYVIGGFMGYLYYCYFKSFRIIVVSVIICYSLAFAILYFLTATTVESSAFYLPTVLRGIAIVLSYIAVGIYATEGVPGSHFLSLLFFNLFIRIFLGPVFWSAVFSNVFYHRLIFHIDQLAGKIDLSDIHHQEVFDPSLQVAIRSGLASDQAFNASKGVAFVRVSNQAALLAAKDIFGGLVIFGVLFIITIFFIKAKETTNKNFKNEIVLP
ncbi:MAG: hypothetical protein JWQ66_2152 [Mucilaginibacter sp.]|nr:hypothetical protein [Mucilaginibacter sp.]